MEEIKNETLETQEQEIVETEEVKEDSYAAVSEELDIPEYEAEEVVTCKKSAFPKVMSIVLLVAAILNFVVGGFFVVTDFTSAMEKAMPYEDMLKDSLIKQAEQYGTTVEELTGGKSIDQAIAEFKADANFAKSKAQFEVEQKNTIIIPSIKALVKDTVNVLVYTAVILGIFALLKCFAIYFKDEEDFEEMFALGCDCDDDCECDCGCEE